MKVPIVNMYSVDPNPTVRGSNGKYGPDLSGQTKIIKHTFQFPANEHGKAKYQRYVDRGYKYTREELEPQVTLELVPESIATNETFPCPDCEGTFTTKGALGSHRRTHK